MTDVLTDSERDRPTKEDVQHLNSEARRRRVTFMMFMIFMENSLSQLHLAAKLGDTEAVRRLLMSSANVDVLDTKHNTPLHYATLNGHVDVVDLLLSKNASVNSRNAFGQTALHLAAKIGHLAIAQILLQSNAYVHVTDQSNNTPIDIATMHCHYELAQLLMNSNEFPLKWVLTLHMAAKCGNSKDVQQRLLNYGENPDTANRNGDTPLHLASQNGHFEVVEVLLRKNADANIRNASFKTPLHIAAEMGHAEIVKAMIDHEGEVSAVDGIGNTALHLAASNGHSAVVNVLLNQITQRAHLIRSDLAVNKVPADEFELSQHPIKNKVDVCHTSHAITAEGGNVEIVDIQLSHSSTASAITKGQATPIHLAVDQGHGEIVKNFMFNGANVNACNNAKTTPLHLACRNGYTSIVEILLDNHAIVDIKKQAPETPFYLAAQNGHADVSNLLMRRGVYDFVEIPYGYETPLQAAVEARHAEVIEVILKHSCRISKKLAKDEQTLQANSKRDVMPVELLKPDGRTVSAEIVWSERNTPLEIKGDSSGRTPLVLTALSFDPKMVQLLLNVDQCMFSETDIVDSFRSIISDDTYYRMNFLKLAQFLINSSKFNVNHQDEELNTFLHDLIRLNYEYLSYGYLTKESNALCLQNQIINDVIQLLLEKGADFNMKNSYGETPLIVASEKGRSNVIQILFDWEEKSGMKLDLDARDRYGATALIKAAEMYHVSVLWLLLSHKVSVNLHDNYGHTVLHTAVYESNPNWLDLYFFCIGLRKLKSNNEDYSQIDEKDNLTWRGKPVNLKSTIFQLEKIRECDEKATRIKEDMIQLQLANDETNVNATDFRGNTPLDLAMKSSKRIHSATLKALKNRGAIRTSLEPEDEALIDMAWVDESGRNPLHRLIISRFSDYVVDDHMEAERKQDEERFDLMVYGILLRPENFRHVVTATDDKGRTPLHYALMPPSYSGESYLDLVRVLLQIGSNVHAADIYGKTPLHYAEMYVHYKLLVQYGADENTKDNFGYTPRKLKQLRESVTMNEDNALKLTIGKNAIYVCSDIAQVLKTVHVTELSIRKLVEMIRIYSQSPRPQESSEEAVWKLWTENELVHLNSRLSQLKILIKHFFERLAAGIKEKDWRFECQPMLVGSADEETQAFVSTDFDFNFILTKFSQICDPFPHPLGPKGYFQLRQKPNEHTRSPSDAKFACFFNLDHCLLTNEVNSRFKIILQEILNDPTFWQDEHLFEWNLIDKHKRKSKKSNGLCKTVRLRMIHPIEDREGGFLFVNISVDVVACIFVEGWWPEDPMPVRISPDVKAKGCTLVFDRPRFDPYKPHGTHFLFSETFARISFAPLESRIIKESSPLIKAAYIVCKMILHFESKTTYQLKTCLLFCMEALTAKSGSETRTEDEITPKHLLFWVERIMFCFMEFHRHDIFPCYFMPSFRQKVEEMGDHQILAKIEGKEMDVSLCYSTVYDKYLDLCPDDTAIDVPIIRKQHTKEILNANHDPKWEQFDREEFIRKLSSRNSC